MSVEHVVSRSVRDTAAVLDAVAGYVPGDPYTAPAPTRPYRDEVGADPGRLRIGFSVRAPGGQFPVDPECATAAREAARLLASLGHRVEEAHPAALDEADAGRAAVHVVSTWTARDLAYWSERTGKTIGPRDVEPMIWGIAEMGRAVSAVDYIRSVEQMQAYTRRMAAWWSEDGFDLLLTPTLIELPPPLGSFDATRDDPMHGFSRGSAFMSTLPFNMTGHRRSRSCHWADGLPVGVQLVARTAARTSRPDRGPAGGSASVRDDARRSAPDGSWTIAPSRRPPRSPERSARASSAAGTRWSSTSRASSG
jgi:amidase